MILDVKKLEKTLLTTWDEFLNIRELRETIKSTAITRLGYDPECSVQKFSLSRFELTATGFLIWLDATIQNRGSQSNITIEFSMSKNGLLFLDHI